MNSMIVGHNLILQGLDMNHTEINEKLVQAKAAFALSKEFKEKGSQFLAEDFYERGMEFIKEILDLSGEKK